MKGLQKLALAAAISAAPFAQAMESLDDSLLDGMTGQAGITLDINLDMSIAEIRYADEDGQGTDIGDGGYLTLSKIKIFGDQGTGTQALIKGVTIDVDGADGIVIGLGQIGGQSTMSQLSAVGAVANSDYWTGVNVTADFGINGAAAGSLEIKNFTNFVPNALAVEGVQKFGYTFDGVGGPRVALVNDDASSTNLLAIAGATAPTGLIAQEYIALKTANTLPGATDQQYYDKATGNVVQSLDAATAGGDNGFATALAAGTHIDASVSISAGGAAGTEGLTINAVIGFVIEEMSFIDDGNKMGIHNFTMYDTNDLTGEITGFTVTGLKIDVIGAAENFVATNSNATEALQISGLKTNGTIAMGDIFIGDHTNGSLGAIAIRDIDMQNTSILIYGH